MSRKGAKARGIVITALGRRILRQLDRGTYRAAPGGRQDYAAKRAARKQRRSAA